MTVPGIRIRPAVEADLPFILSSWVQSYCDRDNGALEVKRVRDSVLKAGHRLLVARLLAADDTVTLVACKDDAENVIVGWSCCTHVYATSDDVNPAPTKTSTLHYVYIKSDFRGNGIARELCHEVFEGDVYVRSTLTFTHYTRAIDTWRAKWENKGVDFLFDPFAALEV